MDIGAANHREILFEAPFVAVEMIAIVVGNLNALYPWIVVECLVDVEPTFFSGIQSGWSNKTKAFWSLAVLTAPKKTFVLIG